MAVINRGLLLKYTKDSHVVKGIETNGVVVSEFYVEADDKHLITKGCLTWVLINIGTAPIFLWNSVEIPPGASFSFPNYTNLPILNNVEFRYDGDYFLTQNNTVGFGTPVDQ